MGIFQRILGALNQISTKLDDIDSQLARTNTHLSTIEGELDKLNKNVLKLLEEETDIVTLDVVVDKPVKQ